MHCFWPDYLWRDDVIVFNMISAAICFHYKFGFPLADLNGSLAVCVCVVFYKHSLSLAAMTPGTLVTRSEPFWAIWVWNCDPHGCALCKITRWGSSGIRAAYDFMETLYHNSWSVCVVLNRSGEWMTTTSVSGVVPKLCGQGNSLFTKCHIWIEVKREMWHVNLFIFMLSLFPIDVHFLSTIRLRIKLAELHSLDVDGFKICKV